jgi:membrane-bound metal-dependent hydrolase YbcI (DUF457 family)
MHGPTHLATGIAAGLGAAIATGRADPLEVAACAAVGGVAALVPDWLQINIPGLSKSIKGLSGHRGFSHWLWTPLALALLAQRATDAPGWLLWACGSGWVSHIALDMLSSGVPAFWPFGGRITLARVKTGGNIDKLIGGAALVVSIALIAFML